MNTNKSIFKNDTISLVYCKDGFWLYDETRGMNLAMRSETEQDAFVSALEYYQKRTKDIEAELKELKSKVDVFVESLGIEIDED